MRQVHRSDLWWADLRPHRGHAQTKVRPVLVVSDDRMHTSGMSVVVPLTGTPGPLRAEIDHDGLGKISYAQADQIRSISVDRLSNHVGNATSEHMSAVEELLRLVLVLPIRR